MNTHKRWYDKDNGCTVMIEQLRDMKHPLVREFSAKCLQRFAKQIRELMQGGSKKGKGGGGEGLVSLGLPALQGLFYAKRENRRWYDGDATMQKAITCLYSLPQEGLTVLSFKLIDIFGLITLYDHVCEETGQEPMLQDFFKITQTVLEVGKEEAEGMMCDILGKDLYDAFCKDIS